MTSLRAARIAKHWTLRRLVEEVDAQAGRPTGLTESLVSQWELGNVHPSMRYRALLADVFAPDKIDFAQAERTTSKGLRLLTSHRDVTASLQRVVRGAERLLVSVGSRSRGASYLEEIEKSMAERPRLVHYRLLYGPPRHVLLKHHLLRLLEICDPFDRTESGVQRLHIGLAPDGYAEENMCASEKEAVVTLPSLASPGNFDTALVLTSPENARGLIAHVQQLYHRSRRIETRGAVEQLPVQAPPPECA